MNTDILRFSRRVPDGSVNLCWIEIPPVEPEGNLSIVETGRYVAENRDQINTESLGSSVQGEFITDVGASGFVYFTSYNPTPSGTGTPISTGVAVYQTSRTPTTAVSPSGFVVNNFTSQIRVFGPVSTQLGVWRLRISDGLIKKKYILLKVDQSWLSEVFSEGDELQVYYTIPETSRIPYLAEGISGSVYLDTRVLDVSGIICAVIDDHRIQIPNQDLVEVLSVLVNGQQIITSTTGQIYAADGVLPPQLPPVGPFTAWDPLAGILTLDRTLHENDEIIANYRYREFLYLYEGYTDDSGVFHNLNLSPQPGHSYDNGRPTSELLNIPIYLYLLPTAAYRTRKADGTIDQDRKIFSGTRWTNSFLRWERTAASVEVGDAPLESALRRSTFGFDYFDLAEFVDTIPVDTLGTSSTTGGSGLAFLPSAVILAKMYITFNSQVEDVLVFDTRQRGGGIPIDTKPSDPRLPGTTAREVSTYLDIGGWDGVPAPLAGTVVVEIPRGVLDGTNGFTQFSRDQIEDMVKKNVASGVRAIIKYI